MNPPDFPVSTQKDSRRERGESPQLRECRGGGFSVIRPCEQRREYYPELVAIAPYLPGIDRSIAGDFVGQTYHL